MSDTSEERTEQATQKRLKEVRDKGKLQKSTDLTAWVGIAAAATVITGTIQAGADAGTAQLFAVRDVATNPSPGAAVRALGEALGSVLPTLAVMLAVVVIAVVAAAAAQGGVHPRKFEPKLEQFNIAKGLQRIFGLQALWQGGKALLKTAAVGLGLFVVVQATTPLLSRSGSLELAAVLAAAGDAAGTLITVAVAAGLGLAALDVLVIRRKNRKQTMMTKKEVRDESKNTDGDPHIKAHRRSRQLAMSRNRMIAAVGQADAVIVNPIHVAVALRYEPGKAAPRITAKGKGIIAARIREEAEKNGVPMVQDVPLARALHDACKLGQEIPVDYYTAVAAVLAFVTALKRRGANLAGIHKIPDNPRRTSR